VCYSQDSETDEHNVSCLRAHYVPVWSNVSEAVGCLVLVRSYGRLTSADKFILADW
jgi:hypothetical protein